MSKSASFFSLRGPLWRRIKWPTWGILGVALLAFAIGSAHAQSTASISGTVKDPTGAVIPGARVVLTSEASRAQWSTTSNGEGFFGFAAIPAATYSLHISRQGFETWTVTGIVVNPGDSLTVPRIALKVGMASVSVVVTAQKAGVTLDSPEHSTMITSGQINRLSTIGRDVSELVTILPGFVMDAGQDPQNEGPGGIYGYQTTSPGSTEIGALGADGAPPGSGQVNITSDGANIIDPGAMNAQDANVNMAQVQEVKVQTADFSAAEAKGPIVIDAVGKSGSAQFHGSLYTYFKNNALNSNDWLSKYYGDPRPEFRYFYPGITLGGPVLIPHTNFNRSKRLVFFFGYEYYDQNAPSGLVTSFIPSPAMMNGDLSTATIAQALNVSPTALVANCPYDYTETATYTNVGGVCWSPGTNGVTSLDQTGATVTNGQIVNIDPAMKTISKLWPKANRTPQPVITAGQLQDASDGINYTSNVMASNNGFQLHTRVDESLTDSLHLYGVYNLEQVNVESPLNNIYYNPSMTVPYPTPEFSYGHSNTLTLDLTKTVGSSFTNDLMAAGVYYSQPQQFADPAKVQTTGTSWAAAGYTGGHLHLNETQLPEIIDYESVGTPSFAFGYVPPSSEFLKKFDWNVKDNVTKVYRTHTFDAGIYAEETGNNQVQLGSLLSGQLTFMRWDTCYINQTPPATATPPPETNVGNIVGEFLIGCPLGYAQANSDPNNNLRYRTLEGYLNDQWKVNSTLTLTLGIRFTHLGPWTDPHGIGLAVWEPSELGTKQGVLYPDTTSNLTWPGVTWHKKDPSLSVAGIPVRALFYQPRVGLAYDLYGNGKTVLRGGWGMYYAQDSTSVASGAESTSIGMQTYTNPSTITCTLGQLFTSQYVPCGAYSSTPTSITPFSVSAVDPKDDRKPLTYNYNFTVDQQGPWKSMFEIAYVGSQTIDQATTTPGDSADLANQNVIPLGAFFKPDPLTGQLNSVSDIPNEYDYAPYPNYEQVNVANHIGWSNYNALQASWNRTSGSLIWGANYTWSKVMGVRGASSSDYNAADPVDLHHDYSVLSFDRPQALNLNYSWEEGTKYRGNRLLGQVLNGWEISGINSIQSGPDLAVVNNTTNFNLSGDVDYTVGSAAISVPVSATGWLGTSSYNLQPEVTCDPRLNLKKDEFVNGGCFALPPLDTEGSWEMPDVHGPAYFKADLTVFKDFKINERQNLQFQLSGFNFLNHSLVSFNNSNLQTLNLVAGETCTTCTYTSPTQALQNATIINASTFGSTAFKNGVRIVELGMKYNF